MEARLQTDQYCKGETAPCVLCGAPAIARCFWPTDVFLSTLVSDLQVGDQIRRLQAKRNRPGRAFVSEITESVRRWGTQIFVDLTIYYKNGHVRYKKFRATPVSRCEAVKPGPCGNPVCELHVRELGPNHKLCKLHWNSWTETEILAA